MESHRRPIREVAEALRAFVGVPRGQVFHVTTDANLYASVLEVAMDFEHHADNVSPFFRLDAPYTIDGAGWDAGAAAARATHAARREAMAEHGYAIGALPAPSTAQTPLARFGATLAQILSAGCAPLSGAVLVLAPGHVADPAAFERELGELTRSLPTVRWILVERDTCSIGPTLAAATRAGHARAVVDEEAALRELEANNEARAEPSHDGVQAVRCWPGRQGYGGEELRNLGGWRLGARCPHAGGGLRSNRAARGWAESADQCRRLRPVGQLARALAE